MILHYIKIAIRNLFKYRLQTIISLVGLSVSMACFALSALWLQYIESYDDFVKDNDRLYLLSPGQNGFQPDAKEYDSKQSIAANLRDTFSEIEGLYSYCSSGYTLVKDDGCRYYYRGIIIEEDVLRELVDIKMPYGRMPKENDTEIAISTSVASRFFGEEDVVGRTINTDGRYGETESKTIVGVFEPLPSNTTLFDFHLISYSDLIRENIGSLNLIKVQKGVDIEELTEKIRKTEVSYSYSVYNVNGMSSIDVNPDLSTYMLLPIRKLRSDYPTAFNGIDGRNIRIVVAVSLIIIISVLCNYFITMITLIRIRCRGLALRRMLGSSVMGIVVMNIIETVILFIGSSLMGAMVIYFIFPKFEYYSHLYQLTSGTLVTAVAKFWLMIFLVGVALTVVATLVTLRKTQHTILHGHQSHHTSTKLDKIANIIQQTVSLCILLCIGTIVMQISYLKNSADLGFEHKNTLSVSNCPPKLKDYVLSLPGVIDSYSPSSPLFPKNSYSPYFVYPTEDSNYYFEAIGKNLNQADIDFWKMTILDGRVPAYNEIMVNETFAKQIGDSVIGRTVRISAFGNVPRTYSIVGLVKDTYESSVITQPRPMVYQEDGLWVDDWNPYLSLSVKFAEGASVSALRLKISEIADSISTVEGGPQSAVYVSDMESELSAIMKNEDMLFSVLMLIAMCTLMTTLFGVFSLLSLSLEQRKKEMALRKIHGATIRQVMVIFLRSNLVTLAISSVIAFPIAYILMRAWLSVYVRQIPFPWYLVIIIFVAMFVIIFLTIIWRIMRAVRENPVEVIKNE